MLPALVYMITRLVLAVVTVVVGREVSKDVELLVLRHENYGCLRWPAWSLGVVGLRYSVSRRPRCCGGIAGWSPGDCQRRLKTFNVASTAH